MQLAMIGLGRMGSNMVRRLLRGGHSCVVYDQNPDSVRRMTEEGALGVSSIGQIIERLTPPRVVWLMLPAGSATERTVTELAPMLGRGDILLDGGNSHYKDDVRRAKLVAHHGVHYIDVGTSGGIWGLDRGYCLMIGGDRESVQRLDPIWKTLAPSSDSASPTPERPTGQGTADQGYLHCGGHGAGHFVKMIHNGIEYGLMQAYAEGFDILRNACSEKLAPELRYELPLGEIAELWRRGSVVGSFLLDMTASALLEDPALDGFVGHVDDSGEGRWTVDAALEQAVSAEVLTAALYARFRSRQDHTFGEKLLSAMRKKFGGHLEPGAKR